MEKELEAALNKCMQVPRTTGAIVINDLALCIGYRGELQESDALPIAELIAAAVGDRLDAKGELAYASGRLQFHRTLEYTLALLRSSMPSPASSLSQTEFPISRSVGSMRSGGTAGTIKGPKIATVPEDH